MTRPGRRARNGLLLFAALLAGTTALGVGVQRASAGLGSTRASTASAAVPSTQTPTTRPSELATRTPTAPTPSAETTPTPSATAPETTAAPTTVPSSAATMSTPPTPLARVLGPGDSGDRVREVQARLKALLWFEGDVTGRYAASTAAAVRGFQAKRGLAADGVVDTRTLRRLEAMSHEPTYGEKHNVVGFSASTDRPLDGRCRTGRVLCIDKTGRTVRWVVDGKVASVMDVRFGASYSPTREGLFSVQSKSRDHVSRLYGSAMPFAMFFSGGQAVHYSSDFAARGYAGASHGCVNVRDRAGVERLFDQVRVGDRVVVYRS